MLATHVQEGGLPLLGSRRIVQVGHIRRFIVIVVVVILRFYFSRFSPQGSLAQRALPPNYCNDFSAAILG